MEGTKFDEGKLRWSLMPEEELIEVLKVLEFGSHKYDDDNWKKVPNLRERALNALRRHISAYVRHEDKDPETGLSHMAHAACNCLFLLWNEKNNPEEKEQLAL